MFRTIEFPAIADDSGYVDRPEPVDAPPLPDDFATDDGDEFELGPISVTLNWQTKGNSEPHLYSREEATQRQDNFGGIYIAVDTNNGNKILKVGKSRNFRNNPGADQRYRVLARKHPGLRFYLATIQQPGGRNVGGVLEAIEDAISRLLYRSGESMPSHQIPFRVQTVVGTVSIRNVLPKPLRDLLPRAYAAGISAPFTDARNQPIPPRQSGKRAPTAANTLYLNPSAYPRWELEIPGQTAEFPLLPFPSAALSGPSGFRARKQQRMHTT